MCVYKKVWFIAYFILCIFFLFKGEGVRVSDILDLPPNIPVEPTLIGRHKLGRGPPFWALTSPSNIPRFYTADEEN
jgi:hypothetical protein